MRIIIKTEQVSAFGEWLEKNLFFKKVNEALKVTYQLGDCLLELNSRVEAKETNLYSGFLHIALHSNNIQAALAYYKNAGLVLETNSGDVFNNPQVYQKGEYYFNIKSPFGVIFEISQKVIDPIKEAEPLLDGLDHVGICVGDISKAIYRYQQDGFVKEFEIVTNYHASGGATDVVMMKKENIVLEIFQHKEQEVLIDKETKIFVER